MENGNFLLDVIYFPPACGLILPECLVGGCAVRTLWIRACVANELRRADRGAGCSPWPACFWYIGKCRCRFLGFLCWPLPCIEGAKDHAVWRERPLNYRGNKSGTMNVCVACSFDTHMLQLFQMLLFSPRSKCRLPANAISHPMLLIHVQLSHPFPVSTTQPPKPEYPQSHPSPT